MGEPAFNLPEDDRPDIRPDIPSLRALEGGGEGDGIPRGKLRSAEGGEDESGKDQQGLFNKEGDNTSVGSGGLAAAEAAAGLAAEQLGKGFVGGASSKVEAIKNLLWKGKNRRRSTIGGGVIGGLLALAFTVTGITSGPLQAIELSQILMKNFAGSENTSSIRTSGLFRFARTKDVGETRAGKLGSMTFAKTTAQLSDIGITFDRNKFTGNPKAMNVDTAKLADKYPELKGMSKADTQAFLSERFGLPTGQLEWVSATGGGHTFTVNTRDFGIKATRVLTRNTLSSLDDGKIVTAIKARAMADFFNTPSLWHPIKKAIASQENKVGGVLDAKAIEEERLKTIDPPPSPEAVQAESSLKDTLKSTQGKFGSALLIAGAMCMVRNVADDVITVNRAAIVVPAARQAADKIAVGAQAQAGQDVTASAVGGVVHTFTDTSGHSIWEAQALNATADPSNPGGKGIDISPGYKQAFSPDTNAANIKDSIGGGTVGELACSTPGVLAQLLVGAALIVSGPFDFGASWGGLVAAKVTLQVVATAGVMYMVEHLATNLFSNHNIIPAVMSGPVGGNLMAYGAREAGGIAGRSSGGVALSGSNATVVDAQLQSAANKQFQSESFLARTFDVHDYRSLISRTIDNQSSNSMQTIGTMATSLLSVNKWVATIASVFNPLAHAASPPYDWGFPQYGIPANLLSDPNYEDPYANADKVATILDAEAAGSQTNYVARAKSCFGVTISKGADGWNAVADGDVNPNSADYMAGNCSDLSDNTWKRVMLFVEDTRTMAAIACRQGTDDQACTDAGIGGGVASTTTTGGGTTGGPVDAGTSPQLAQKILNYRATGQYNCDNPGDCADLQKVVAGQTLSGSQGCTAQTLDTHVLQLLLYAIEVGKFKIGTYAMCGDHSHDGAHGHSGGYAVDISSVNGVGVNQNSAQAKTNTLALDKFFNALPAALTLSQQISYGYGNHYDADLAATQMYGSKLCTTSCVSIYTLGVESEHENHIHAGY